VTNLDLAEEGAGLAAPARRFWIAGVPVDVVGRREIIAMFDHAVMRETPFVLANLNLHGLYCALTSAAMGKLLASRDTIVHIDGTPIVWAAKLAGMDIPPDARNAHIDLIPELLTLCAARGWPVVIVNSDQEGAGQNQAALETLVPGLQVAALSGYFDHGDMSQDAPQQQVIDQIIALRPALLLVGMGMPRQEAWIARIRTVVDVPMIMPVGGFADYFTGRTRMPPRFLGPLGLEWAYRLFHDPRRLGFRYLIEPVLLLCLLIKRMASGTKWGRQRDLNGEG
jgi:N-acetylglucosaminyldiphosphoundecaprenol N-acetyl-beta-D-mannosaminyltransferase